MTDLLADELPTLSQKRNSPFDNTPSPLNGIRSSAGGFFGLAGGGFFGLFQCCNCLEL